jgi:hypothetical protein
MTITCYIEEDELESLVTFLESEVPFPHSISICAPKDVSYLESAIIINLSVAEYTKIRDWQEIE